ncbi:indole-3-glycerol phosphate synthase TrpC [Lentibacillus halophilus]|uniref:Indole-3-glycerol phosphate synthase n=1 Tax=Lentibacillus halophilus TaxID=295065 RepID=A0ABN0Z381_9BACI
MTILDHILREKEKEIASLQGRSFHNAERKAALPANVAPSFRNSKQLNLIAEIKRSSPSKGEINTTIDPVQQAKWYEACGADAISVLTDETFFHGSMDDLQAVSEAVNLPVLCKDFIIDPIQIDRAKAAGTSIILLIVAAMSEAKLHELYAYASEQRLDVLCEVHNEQEMETAIKLGATIIGINNRDLKTFDVNLSVTKRLAAMVTDRNTVLISESGMQTRDDAASARNHGAHGILVGETLMRSEDVPDLINTLKVPVTEGSTPDAR